MFLTVHVLSGALLGAVYPRPVPVFATAVASHLVLDAVPHWGTVDDATFLRAARADGLLGLAVLAAVGLHSPRSCRSAVWAGMAGAVLLDVDKPALHFFGRSLQPGWVLWIHQRVQREWPGGLRTEAPAAALLAVLLARVYARRQRQPQLASAVAARSSSRSAASTSGEASASRANTKSRPSASNTVPARALTFSSVPVFARTNPAPRAAGGAS
jgi:hypothetical protein